MTAAMQDALVFAKQGDAADVTLAFLLLAVVVVIALVAAAIRGPARYDLVLKGGLPYCPRCRRQVSYRRDVCRACGYTFKTYGAAPRSRFDTRSARDEEEAAWLAAWLETEEGRRETAAAREAAESAEKAGGRPVKARAPAATPQGERLVDGINALSDAITRWGDRRADRLAARRSARDAAYVARGVEPGPLAWYRALPDWGQAIVLGLAVAAPAVAAIAFLMR